MGGISKSLNISLLSLFGFFLNHKESDFLEHDCMGWGQVLKYDSGLIVPGRQKFNRIFNLYPPQFLDSVQRSLDFRGEVRTEI